MKTSRQIKGLLVTVALMAYFASASCILLSLQAEAQTIEHVLRGLSQIALLAGKPNKASLDCGLNTDTIRRLCGGHVPFHSSRCAASSDSSTSRAIAQIRAEPASRFFSANLRMSEGLA